MRVASRSFIDKVSMASSFAGSGDLGVVGFMYSKGAIVIWAGGPSASFVTKIGVEGSDDFGAFSLPTKDVSHLVSVVGMPGSGDSFHLSIAADILTIRSDAMLINKPVVRRYPQRASFSGVKWRDVGDSIKKMLSVKWAAAVASSFRPILASVHVVGGTVEATNSWAMAYTETDVFGADDDFSVDLDFLSRVASLSKDIVSVGVSAGTLSVRGSDWAASGRLLHGEYPDTKPLRPDMALLDSFSFDRGRLIQILDVASGVGVMSAGFRIYTGGMIDVVGDNVSADLPGSVDPNVDYTFINDHKLDTALLLQSLRATPGCEDIRFSGNNGYVFIGDESMSVIIMARR